MNTEVRSMLAPYESGYSNNQTLELTKKRKNQVITEAPTISSKLASLFISCTKPFACCFGYSLQVTPSNDVIVSEWETVTKVLREPGFYWLGGCGVNTQEVYVGGWTANLIDIPVNDRDAFPCFVSAAYNYQVVDAISATFKTPDYQKFVKKQAKAALQRVFSGAVYNNYNNRKIENKIVEILQEYVTPIGIQINSFKITGIAVSSKMQKLLLARQEAEAYITGRRTIAQGAVSVLSETLKNLQKEDIKLSPSERNALIVDLIYMIIQSDDVKIRFIEGNPSDTQAVAAIATETPHNPNKKEKV